MTLQTDDIITRQEDIFKGNEHFAIPFNARYGAWVVGVVLSATMSVAAANLFLPAFQHGGPRAVVAAFIVAATIAVPVGLQIHKIRPNRARISAILVFLLVFEETFTLASSGGPRGSLTGLGMAVLFGIGGSVLAVRIGGKYVDAVTPWKYRLAVAKAEFRAPRPHEVVCRTVVAGSWVEDQPPTSRVVLPPTEKADPTS